MYNPPGDIHKRKEVGESSKGRVGDIKDTLRNKSEISDNLKEKQIKSVDMYVLFHNIKSLNLHAEKYKEIKKLKGGLEKIYDYKMRWLKEEENSDILKYEILMFTDENGKKQSRGIDPKNFSPAYYYEERTIGRTEALDAFDQASADVTQLLSRIHGLDEYKSLSDKLKAINTQLTKLKSVTEESYQQQRDHALQILHPQADEIPQAPQDFQQTRQSKRETAKRSRKNLEDMAKKYPYPNTKKRKFKK